MESEAGFVASRGRLVSRVERWDDGAARALAGACVLRARDRAVEALEREGRRAEADELRRVEAHPAIADRAQALARGASPEIAGQLGFAADAVAMSRGAMPDSTILADAGAADRGGDRGERRLHGRAGRRAGARGRRARRRVRRRVRGRACLAARLAALPAGSGARRLTGDDGPPVAAGPANGHSGM